MFNTRILFYFISIILIQMQVVFGDLKFINSTTSQSLDPTITGKSYTSIFANFQSEDLVSFPSTTSHVGLVYPFVVLIEPKCVLTGKLMDDLSKFSRRDIFLLVKRAHIIERCIHVSDFVRKVQSLLPQVQGLLIDVSSALIPGYFSSESYKYPGEDTSDLFLAVYELDTVSFNSIVSDTKSHFESSEDNPMLVASINPSTNLWSEMYSNPGFLSYRYIFLVGYLIIFIYVAICLVIHVFLPLIQNRKRLTTHLSVVVSANFFYSLERLIHYSYDPFMVKSEQVITGFTVMFFVAVWLGFMSYTALSFMYVRIVRSLTECFIWKYRYHLWFFVIALLPISIICILVRFFLGSGISTMILGAYITILTLFESIVLIHYGRKVLVMIHQASKTEANDRNAIYKRITISVIFSSVLFLLILIVSIVSSLSETLIVKSPSFFVATQALLDIFAGSLCVSMVSTMFGFRSAPTTSDNTKSSSNLKRNDKAEMSIS